MKIITSCTYRGKPCLALLQPWHGSNVLVHDPSHPGAFSWHWAPTHLVVPVGLRDRLGWMWARLRRALR